MGFLVSAATVALKLVVAAQGLRVAKVPQAARDGGVLFHVNAEIKEVLVLAGYGFAIQASGFTSKNA